MGLLKFPDNHTPRYCDFSIDGILDETIREGAERCAFSVPAQDKIPLISKILQSGVRDIVYGSGPNDPTYLIQTINDLQDSGGLPAGTRFSFIMLLNCHEPIMPQFESFPNALKDCLTISFGMASYKSDAQLFERATEQLRAWGFNSFRVSLLNNFSTGIDEESYEKITVDIDRSLAQGIQTVRINDSLGTLYPEAMAVLAAIESLDLIFKERNIIINQHPLDSAAVVEAARLSERTFLSMPDLYRPVSGHIVNQENMGVANIPAFLGAARDIPYFLNSTGLHDATVQRILQDEGLESEANDDATVQAVKQKLDAFLTDAYPKKHKEFERIRGELIRFYASDVVYASTVGQYARNFIE